MGDKTTTSYQTNEFEEKIARLSRSEAYLDFCQEVYGYRLPLFNMMDREQFDFLFSEMKCSAANVILDLGCGSGSVLQYVTDKFGCKGVGIDLLSRELLPPDGEIVRYISGDFDRFCKLVVKPSITLCIDSLYFSKDLGKLLSQIHSLQNNRAFLFYSQYIFEENPSGRTILQVDHTVLAEQLKRQNISYRAVDFSENERVFYPVALSTLEKQRDKFRLEGNSDLYEKLLTDNLLGKELYDTGCASRYLYIFS